MAAATAADAAPADAPETTLVGRIVAAQKERLSAVVEVVAEKLVRLLELIDGRLPKFNGTVRQILGLVALATVGTSTIVLVLSLF